MINFKSSMLLVALTATGTANTALADWYFRGTPNGWDTAQMQWVGGNTMQTCQQFQSGDQHGGPRFKVDRWGEWSQNYPTADYQVSGNQAYQIQFDTVSHQFNLTPVSSCGGQSGGDTYTTLGAVYSPSETTFAIWSPDSNAVELWLDGQPYTVQRSPDLNGYQQVYAISIAGDHHLKSYQFRINGIPVRDPYGVMVEPNTNTNIVMDLDRTDPVGGWAARPVLEEREDSIIYEIHVRDFTIDSSSGVTPDKRGKFLGMVQPGTTYDGVKTGIDHLKELGVTHVQLLPIYDFATCADLSDNSCYNWGYDPRNFNVPEERYSVSQDYEDRVRELKTMINEFHKAGIRVIMDVVYNHTYGYEMFENISNRYYTDTDLSGTGNSIDADVPMVSRMIQDSLEYWTREYNLDGFRFDLIGIFDHDEVGAWGRHLNELFPDRNLLLYGEPWNGYASDPRELQRVRLGTIAREHTAHVGVFNPKFREAIKGQNDSAYGGGFAFNQGDNWQIRVGSRGGIRYNNDPYQNIDLWDSMFATDPEQSINYVSAHDNLSLRDKILEWADLNGISRSSDYLRRIHNFANGIVLTSQGIPFLHGGVEMLRDKQGNHNSYNASDEVNKVRWHWKKDNADIFNYYKDVIALRKAHKGFRMNSWDEITNNVHTYEYAPDVVVSEINAAANGDTWNRMIVIYHAGGNFHFPLPSGNWYVAMEKSDPAQGNGRAVSGSLLIEGTAVTVLYQ